MAASPASQGFLPEEGATGWSDTWMISSEAEASELHVHVDELDHRTEGECRGGGILRRGARAGTGLRKHQEPELLREYHAEEPAFWKRVYYWETPLEDCGNGSSDCKNYNDWVQAWTSIKG